MSSSPILSQLNKAQQEAVNKQPNQFTHPWTKREITFVEKNIGKMTYKQMSVFINRTPASIQSKVRYLLVKQKVKKYPINQDFFKNWSPEMAYVLGYIAADGNISKHGRAHMLQLASDDKDVIQKIRRIMRARAPIFERKRENGKTSYQFRVSDPIIFADLNSLGITTRKSLTLASPKVPSKYLNHYLRGFFDGDGSVYINKKSNKGRLVFVWYTASPYMAQFLLQFTQKVCPEFKGKIQALKKKKGDYYSIVLWKRDAKIMFQLLYKNASIYMGRKYKKFLKGTHGL